MRIVDSESAETPEINLLPMIDVIFAILTYFILATLFLTKAEELPVDLPNANTASPQQQPTFTVTVQSDGQIALDQEPIALGALRRVIQDQIQPAQKPLITLNADQRVSHGRVIEVMDELRMIEGAQLGIATAGDRSE